MRAITMLAAVASLWREERMSVPSQTLMYPDLSFTDTFDEVNLEQFQPWVLERTYAPDAIPSFYSRRG